MALINRFADPAEERAYVQGERAIRLKTTRILVVISMAIYLGFSTLNPIFFPGEVLIFYNITVIFLVVLLAFSYFVTSTRYYLEWPWLGFLAFIVICATTPILALTLGQTEDVTGPLEL